MKHKIEQTFSAGDLVIPNDTPEDQQRSRKSSKAK